MDNMNERFSIGDKCIMTENAIDNYGNKYKDKVLTICHIAHDKSEHPGYDESISPECLYDFIEINFSLYDYEIDEV